MNDLIAKLKNSGLIKDGNNFQSNNSRSRINLEEFFQGEWKKGDIGNVFVMEDVISYQSKHGNVKINKKYQTDKLLRLFNISSERVDLLNNSVFLDIETSNLSFGAGSFVFLIGLCYFSNDGLHSKLLFIDSPSHEPALLLCMEKLLSEFSIIFSYNGKSFDLPFLKNRFHFHKIPFDINYKFHIDLLHIVRRLWKNSLNSCKLSELEKQILVFKRDSDEIPGWLVPQIYYDFLSSGDVNSLVGIFYHNKMDVISLAALTIFLGNHLGSLNKNRNLNDIFNIANAFVINKDLQAAKDFYERGFELYKEMVFKIPVINYRNYGFLLKHLKDYCKAIKYWEIAGNAGDYISSIELSKYFEHRKKDFSLALIWAIQAKKSVIIKSRAEINHKRINDIDHRISRLNRKIKKYEKQAS